MISTTSNCILWTFDCVSIYIWFLFVVLTTTRDRFDINIVGMSCSLYHHIAVDINIRLARNLLQTAQKDFYPIKNLRCGMFVCPSCEIFKTTIGSKFTIIKTNFLSCSYLNYQVKKLWFSNLKPQVNLF